MKGKIIFALLIVVALVVAGYTWYQSEYGGENYYTQIVSTGKKEVQKTDSGEKFTRYFYNQAVFNKDGKEIQAEFSSVANAEPLRKNAYLEILYNKKKGVISWQEVEEKDVPKPAMEKLKE
ncbi:conserved hypothetical protein TIGR01655 [Pilibacter termitis]|uniref:YxeA family protein n=1 Tax=Pilibacter termitis TaxID=263852 RepID=A0A1T4LY74_9ENTE|nr:YxeA family protein [Pilibacter termitis]SJZ59478.1 conserved hypothetical protein TIGR01655 [Pilibacter termitis]